ncbi:MAG: hypothetical protein NTX48_00115 [Planctomycetales bacterium]|nr:hypothetical protein [Planctomycetales bacterium]
MKDWKVYSAHENIVLGKHLTFADARIIAQKWAETAGRRHPGYVPGWIIDAEGSIITILYREERVAVCESDDSKLHMQLPCMCEAGVTGLYDSKLAR